MNSSSPAKKLKLLTELSALLICSAAPLLIKSPVAALCTATIIFIWLTIKAPYSIPYPKDNDDIFLRQTITATASMITGILLAKLLLYALTQSSWLSRSMDTRQIALIITASALIGCIYAINIPEKPDENSEEKSKGKSEEISGQTYSNGYYNGYCICTTNSQLQQAIGIAKFGIIIILVIYPALTLLFLISAGALISGIITPFKKGILQIHAWQNQLAKHIVTTLQITSAQIFGCMFVIYAFSLAGKLKTVIELVPLFVFIGFEYSFHSAGISTAIKPILKSLSEYISQKA